MQQPGNFTDPPQPPRRNIWRWYRARNPFLQIGLGCLSLVVLLFAGVFCAASIAVATGHGVQVTPTPATVAQATATSLPTSRPTSAATVTSRPTPTATRTPEKTPTTTKNGDPAHALLGGTLSDFTARYGPYMSNSDVSQHSYDWTIYGKGKKDLSVTFIYNTHADGVIYAAPEPQLWTYDQAKSACLALLPSDAQYQRKMTIYDASGKAMDEQLVYYVPSIASFFPASTFNDENGNQTKAGTIGLILTHWSDTTYVQCVLQIGLESK